MREGVDGRGRERKIICAGILAAVKAYTKEEVSWNTQRRREVKRAGE